jgi:hypothetical protein
MRAEREADKASTQAHDAGEERGRLDAVEPGLKGSGHGF